MTGAAQPAQRLVVARSGYRHTAAPQRWRRGACRSQALDGQALHVAPVRFHHELTGVGIDPYGDMLPTLLHATRLRRMVAQGSFRWISHGRARPLFAPRDGTQRRRKHAASTGDDTGKRRDPNDRWCC